ncbi:MAG: serine/threonine protein kinase [Polyangiaceae bacterium]|nr:serine/threonine protein kinase [Polyangiaceae bacterium]
MSTPNLSGDPPEPALAPGDVLARKYRLETPLGEGNMAVVWVAQNMALETQVAVKILRAGLATDPRVVARFRQEAKATAAIAHKNIVQVYDYGVTGWGAPFIVMELLQGETLEQRLKRQGSLAPEEAVKILLRVMKGVTVAHAKGVIHRDLKPENVFLVREENGVERPKVLDFGVSFVTRTGAEDRLTKAGGVVGTPSYLPPEAIEGDSRGDVRGDVWALGVMLYEMTSGHLPFQGKTVPALLDAICKETPRPLQGEINGVDGALQRILDRALAKEPDERFPGVREFFDELNHWLNGRGLLLSTTVPTAAQALAGAGEEEDDPTLIGPSLDSMGSIPAAQDRSPSSSREMITPAIAPRDSSPAPPRVFEVPSAQRPRSRHWPLLALGAALVLALGGAFLLRGQHTRSATPPVPPAPSAPGPEVSALASATAAPSASLAPLASGLPTERAPEQVTLEILGLPERALVRVDGHRVERLPVVLRRGQTVLLRVDAPAHEPWQQELIVEGSLKLRYAARPLAPTPRSTSTSYRDVPY